MKGGIAVLASLVTVLGFFGLRTIYDLFPNAKDQEQVIETQTAERASKEYEHHLNQGTDRPVAPAGTSEPIGGTPASSSVTTADVTGKWSGEWSTPKGSPTPEKDPAASTRPARPATSRLPIEFSLRDGEVKTLLGDQASLGIAFNSIGEEEFVTLNVSTPDGGSVPHAILSSGVRLEFALDGDVYYVYVLRINQAEKAVTLRVARAMSGR